MQFLSALAPFLSYHPKPERRKTTWMSRESNPGEQAPQADAASMTPWPLRAEKCHGDRKSSRRSSATKKAANQSVRPSPV